MAITRPTWRRWVPAPVARAPLTRSAPELLWTLHNPRTQRLFVKCAVCTAGDAYELLVDSCDGEFRWGYHSMVAAQLGAARLRERLVTEGWTESEPPGEGGAVLVHSPLRRQG